LGVGTGTTSQAAGKLVKACCTFAGGRETDWSLLHIHRPQQNSRKPAALW